MNILEIIFRTIFVYFFIILAIRIMGKREVGELGLFDLVVLLIIADIAVLSIELIEIPFYYFLVSIVIITFIEITLSKITLKSNKIRGLLDGKPIILMYDNQLILKALRKERYNLDDLLTKARLEGINCLLNIDIAILESNGEISFFLNNNYEDIKPLPVIVSGELVLKNLLYLKIPKEVILNKLEKPLKSILYANYFNDELLILKQSEEI